MGRSGGIGVNKNGKREEEKGEHRPNEKSRNLLFRRFRLFSLKEA